MKLKAYGWDDEDYDESHVVWAATPGKAKALLASEHDREFTEMRVYRVPWADKYEASKIIPAKEFLRVVRNGTATVLDEVEILCDECAKDWSEEK